MRMRDIAHALGVSTMTVSRALRSDASVAPATRQAILQAIAQAGYVPNQIAGSLSSKRSGFVAVLVPSLNNSHFSETVLSLGDQMADLGVQLLIGNTGYDRDKETALVRAFLARKPEAVILTADGHTAEVCDLLARATVPVIEIWDQPEHPIQHVVGFSNRDAMCGLIRTMIDSGYRKISYLGEHDDSGTRGSARRQGYCDAVAEAGLGQPRLCAISHPPATMSDGEKALTEILARYPDTDLIACVSDPLAFGVIAACQRRGLSVPEDIAVSGFGDFEISRIAKPSITTVNIDAGEIGRELALLIARISDWRSQNAAHERENIAVAVRPVLRESAPGR